MILVDCFIQNRSTLYATHHQTGEHNDDKQKTFCTKIEIPYPNHIIPREHKAAVNLYEERLVIVRH